MTSADLIYYRLRAAEARSLAELALDTGTKKIHRQLAEEYEARVRELEMRQPGGMSGSPA